MRIIPVEIVASLPQFTFGCHVDPYRYGSVINGPDLLTSAEVYVRIPDLTALLPWIGMAMPLFFLEWMVYA